MIRWRNWTKVSSIFMNLLIIINGRLIELFFKSWGLRKENPFFPFVLVGDGLSKFTEIVKWLNFVQVLIVEVSYVQFANETTFFSYF